MLQRVLVVYNSKSSHHAAIQDEILGPVRRLRGALVGKFEVRHESLERNVQELIPLINEGDLILVAGGDGTATLALNALVRSGKRATLAVFGYGNLNDMAGMLGITREMGVVGVWQRFLAGNVHEIYPLEVTVNGRLWRYAPCYVTLGLLAESATMMETQEVRQKLRTGKQSRIFSLRMAIKWYWRNRKRNFLPAKMTLNGQKIGDGKRVTDYLAVNSPVMAGMMKGGDWYRQPEKFGSTVQSLGKFWKMVKFGLRSVRKSIPLTETMEDTIRFGTLSEVEIQAEGEYQCLADVEEIVVKKSARGVRVVLGGE